MVLPGAAADPAAGRSRTADDPRRPCGRGCRTSRA